MYLQTYSLHTYIFSLSNVPYVVANLDRTRRPTPSKKRKRKKKKKNICDVALLQRCIVGQLRFGTGSAPKASAKAKALRSRAEDMQELQQRVRFYSCRLSLLLIHDTSGKDLWQMRRIHLGAIFEILGKTTRYLDSENYNWSCRTHTSEFGGEMWWCCGKAGMVISSLIADDNSLTSILSVDFVVSESFELHAL